MNPLIQSVSQFTWSVRDLLEEAYPEVWIQGEISNLAKPASGHLYFSLKDEKAQVRCALFRSDGVRLREQPVEGAAVVLRGKVSLYAARGDFQIIVDYMESAGEGELRRRFIQLKGKLESEGLFDPNHKRSVPDIPTTFGVITSPAGAALQDILSTLQRRFPSADVLLFPVSVQGSTAAGDIAHALHNSSRGPTCDCVIVARGGGSLEDLWAFNEEVVVRAIRQCRSPVVTGIGHETDVTLADFAADIRAATPTAAAETVTPDRAELIDGIEQLRIRLHLCSQRTFREKTQELDGSAGRLQHPLERIVSRWQLLANRQTRLLHSLDSVISQAEHTIDRAIQALRFTSPAHRISTLNHQHIELTDRIHRLGQRLTVPSLEKVIAEHRKLTLLNPIDTLGRGYAIVRNAVDGTILTQSTSVKAGDPIEAQLHKGWLRGTVTKTSQGSRVNKDKA